MIRPAITLSDEARLANFTIERVIYKPFMVAEQLSDFRERLKNLI